MLDEKLGFGARGLVLHVKTWVDVLEWMTVSGLEHALVAGKHVRYLFDIQKLRDRLVRRLAVQGLLSVDLRLERIAHIAGLKLSFASIE